MPTSGQLVKAIADALLLPHSTVALYDRALSEAGVRTKGGRGRSAAQMTTLDAANLLIAIISSPISGPSIATAFENWKQYAQLTSAGGVSAGTQTDRSFLTAFNASYRQLLGSALGAKPIAKAPETKRLTDSFEQACSIPEIANLGHGHSFAEVLAAIIDAFVSGSIQPIMEPEHGVDRFLGQNPLIVVVGMPLLTASVEFTARNWVERLEYRVPGTAEADGIRYTQLRYIYFGTLRLIAEVFAESAAS